MTCFNSKFDTVNLLLSTIINWFFSYKNNHQCSKGTKKVHNVRLNTYSSPVYNTPALNTVLRQEIWPTPWKQKISWVTDLPLLPNSPCSNGKSICWEVTHIAWWEIANYLKEAENTRKITLRILQSRSFQGSEDGPFGHFTFFFSIAFNANLRCPLYYLNILKQYKEFSKECFPQL